MNCCWHGTIEQFLNEEETCWLNAMQANFKEIFKELPHELQVRAWKDCYHVLHESLIVLTPSQKSGYIVFEYLLPREGGRRPDVLLIIGGHILVLEFKQKVTYNEADLDQAANYARDLQEYHLESRDYSVLAYLVATRRKRPGKKHLAVEGLAPFQIVDAINAIPFRDTHCDIEQWLTSEYVPLPSLVNAAIDIFNNRDLPYIRRANSYGIPQALAVIETIKEQAELNNERHIIFVTGVPGAGKTLLGLQTVYSSYSTRCPAVFLSGNTPLMRVLSHQLGNKALLKELHKFVDTYMPDSSTPPREHVVVFDEAQRAWEVGYKKNKYPISEPEQLLKICNGIDGWCVLIALLGEGQEIYLGEEAGTQQWVDALNKSSVPWHIHASDKLADIFAEQAAQLHSSFELNHTLRSHTAVDVTQWIEFILSGQFAEAAKLYERIKRDGFSIYITDDLEKAKRYCSEKYREQTLKTYGLMASSVDRTLSRFGIKNGFNDTQAVHYGKWYCAPHTDAGSCRQLKEVVTEFGCQGLELDMPIVCWGDDVLWRENQWVSRGSSGAQNPHRLRLNSYRVLLSRGRDGIILFVPSLDNFEQTKQVLLESGCIPLKMSGLKAN